MAGTAKNDDNDGNGTIVVSEIVDEHNPVIRNGVMLDVSGASGPVTVTGESGECGRDRFPCGLTVPAYAR